MVSFRPIAAWVCGLVLLHAPASAAVLIGEYALRGTLADKAGGTPLAAFGGQITALGYVFAGNQGLAFSSPLFTPTNFSLELSFKLDGTAGEQKIVDFQHLTTSVGVFDRDGSIGFSYQTVAGPVTFSAGSNVDLVLTRDSTTNVVTGYVNGQQQFAFVDTFGLTVPSGGGSQLNFFLNGSATQGATSGGTVNYLRVYNGALTAREITALYAAGPPYAVPEPETLALLPLGLALVAWTRRRRGRK